MQRITPYLLYEDVAGALIWLARAFGLREFGSRMLGPDGKVNQAAMILDDSIIMLGCPGPDYQNPKRVGYVTQNVYVTVHDVDKCFERARDAGATILQKPEVMVYGERRFIAADPEGHHWYFAQRVPVESRTPQPLNKASLKSPRTNLFLNFAKSTYQLAFMDDPLKVQQHLSSNFGINLSVDEISSLKGRPPKLFNFGLIELWAAKQPQEALAWVASISWPHVNLMGVDLPQLFLNGVRKTLPNLNRDLLDWMLPEGPGKDYVMDIAEAITNPYSLANRILSLDDPIKRTVRLKALAQGWPDPETSVEWARENLSGIERKTFYSQVGYRLAEQNPQAALQVLAELRTDSIEMKGYCLDQHVASQVFSNMMRSTYAFTLEAMMRGLVEIGGHGQKVSELIANSDLKASERARLVTELTRHWVRQNADDATVWVKTLTAPEDIRAAIPLLVSQLDNDGVKLAVEAYLNNPDPVMELALIETAAPRGLQFDPQKSRLILDPLISKDPAFKLRASKGRAVNREEMLWKTVKLTARQEAEVGSPTAAIEWLGTLPFASQRDYARAVAAVLTVWNLKSPTEAAEWVENSALNPSLKSVLQNIVNQ
jgi:uncharacterized glyoxalase superfamily protein PhnB